MKTAIKSVSIAAFALGLVSMGNASSQKFSNISNSLYVQYMVQNTGGSSVLGDTLKSMESITIPYSESLIGRLNYTQITVTDGYRLYGTYVSQMQYTSEASLYTGRCSNLDKAVVVEVQEFDSKQNKVIRSFTCASNMYDQVDFKLNPKNMLRVLVSESK
ncbi:hypothetical protein [Cysteiniphilum litorale]|uniref:hypothetical protein n=1 Tax=Cysteiniphilum litorale TaxID=2056700 RepID=UPI003F884E70